MKGLLLISSCLFLCCGAIMVTNHMNAQRNIPTWNPPIGLAHEHLELFKRISSSSSLPPVVCIPGVGGSQLTATANRTRPDKWYCGSNSKGYLIWLSLTQLVPGPALECWENNMALEYNQTTGLFSNATGVGILVDYFGSTLGFEYLDPSVKSETVYFANLVNSLTKLGYIRGQNLLGAPYDWRLAPLYQPGYFQELQQMIESAYSVNQSRVAIVAHSLGNLFFLSFLQTVTQAWKDQYILTYVATSPPWVGAFTAIQSITSGYNFGIPFLPAASAKIVQRTFASTYYLMPYPKFYSNEVLVSAPGKNYTAQNYEQLLTDLGVSEMYEPYTKLFNTANPYDPPGVNTYCLYGYNLSTITHESYTNSQFTRPQSTHGDGDGTVPVESLTFCQNWVSDKKVIIKGYKGQEHVDILSYPPFIQDVLGAILNATL